MKKSVSLKILDSINVEKPCHESWDGMTGNDKERFCARCQHSVNNISEMTREEVATLIAKSSGSGRLCIRYKVGTDGSIQYKAPIRPAKTTWQYAASVAFGLLAIFRFSSSARAENTVQGDFAVRPQAEVKLGEMVAITPLPTPVTTPEVAPTLPCHTMGSMVAPVENKSETKPPIIMGKVAPPK